VRIAGSQRLATGDVIRIGDSELVFQASTERHTPLPRARRSGQVGGQPRRISLPKGGTVLTIGRGPDCDLVLEDNQVSKRHAQIRRQDSFMFLYELGSKNGTYLNGKRLVEPRPVRSGDVIRVGCTGLVI
jgi:pSer/pThr/pTyr-binding forkhead associated (FHA) protein